MPHTSTYLHRQVQAGLSLCSDQADLNIIVAPSRDAATALRTSIAQLGTPTINVEALTPAGLSKHIWTAQKPEESHKYLSRPAVSYLIGHFLEALDTEMAQLLSGSIRTLTKSILADREASVDSASLAAAASDAVQQAYAQIYGAYERYRSANGRMDDVDVVLAAHQLVMPFVEQRHVASLFVSDLVSPSALEIKLIEHLGQNVPHAMLMGSGTVQNPLIPSWDYLPGFESKPSDRPISWLTAPTRREEVRTVLSDIVERNIAFDQVEIAYTDPSMYASELITACDRFGIPWQAAASSKWDYPMHQHLRLFAQWVESGYSASSLANMLRSHLVSTDAFGCPPEEFAQMLTAFPLRFTRFRHPDVWKAIQEKAYDRGISAATLVQFEQFVAAVLPYLLPTTCTVQQFGKAFVGFSASFSTADLPPASFQEFWQQTIRISQEVQLPPSASTRIARHVLEVPTPSFNAQQIGVRIGPLKDTGYGVANRIYVLGLDDQAAKSSEAKEASEASVFSGIQKPVDVHRPVDSWELTTRQLIQELSLRFPSDLVLCASSFDVESGRLLFPSAAWVAFTQQSELKASKRMSALDLVEFKAATPFDHADQAYPNLRWASHAEEARSSSQWTAYDGLVDRSAFGPLETATPSKLEVLSSCPYKFFLSEVLGVRRPREREEEWLTKMEEGSLVHSLFEFHTRQRLAHVDDAPRSVEPEDFDRLMGRVQTALAQSALLLEGNVGALVERKAAEIGLSVSLFLKREKKHDGVRTPVGVEYSFGNGVKQDAPPCILHLQTGALALSGRLDRLDRLPNGDYVITDYKTGRFSEYAPKDLKKLAQHLQWAIYSLMVANHQHVRVERFEYFFPSVRGAGLVRGIAAPTEAEVLQLLETLSKRYGSGAFIQSADKQTCQYCDYLSICGDVESRKGELAQKFIQLDHRIEEVYGEWPYRQKVGKE